MGSLYEQLLKALAPMEFRPSEQIRQFCDRYAAIRAKQLERDKLASKLRVEKQFNRKVEINASIRKLETEIDAMSDPNQQVSITEDNGDSWKN